MIHWTPRLKHLLCVLRIYWDVMHTVGNFEDSLRSVGLQLIGWTNCRRRGFGRGRIRCWGQRHNCWMEEAALEWVPVCYRIEDPLHGVSTGAKAQMQEAGVRGGGAFREQWGHSAKCIRAVVPRRVLATYPFQHIKSLSAYHHMMLMITIRTVLAVM